MAYFNYFIKCIIRRFVRLFFTKKTFIFIIVCLILFCFFQNSCFASYEEIISKAFFYLFTNSSMTYVSSRVIGQTGANFPINVPKGFYIYEVSPGNSYKFVTSNPNEHFEISVFVCYDLDFIYQITEKNNTPPTTDYDESISFTNIHKYYYQVNYYFSTGIKYYLLIPDTVTGVDLAILHNEVTSSDVAVSSQQTQDTIKDTSQQTQDTIKDTSQQMQNTITDSSVDVSTDLPTNDTQDITQDGFNNIFMTIKDTFTSSSAKDLVVNIPFTDKSFTINFSNVYSGFNSGIVGTLITLFWWYCVSLFIVKDISNKISKIKGGNLENIENTNIKEDLL